MSTSHCLIFRNTVKWLQSWPYQEANKPSLILKVLKISNSWTSRGTELFVHVHQWRLMYIYLCKCSPWTLSGKQGIFLILSCSFAESELLWSLAIWNRNAETYNKIILILFASVYSFIERRIGYNNDFLFDNWVLYATNQLHKLKFCIIYLLIFFPSINSANCGCRVGVS